MTRPTNIKQLIICAIAGVILGYIGGPVQILALWALIGITIGYFSSALRLAALNGAVFGFIMSFVFMLHGYNGTDPIETKLLPFAILGIFGALCGAILALIGKLLQRTLRKRDAAT